MTNHSHPLETEADEICDTRRAVLALFSRDGVICERERTVLDRLTNHEEDITDYRLREEAGYSYIRNGITRHSRRRFEAAGAGIIDLVAERRTRRPNIVTFRSQRDGPDAA